MCSIESRLENEQTPHFTMIDSSNQPSPSGLATALRDRSSCTIPNQPNRSLPVRPAPHIPCRSAISRRTLQTQSLNSNSRLESSESAGQSVTTSSDRNLQDPRVGLIRIEVPGWHSDIRQPYINIVNLSTVQNSSSDSQNNRGVKRKVKKSDDNVTTSNCSLIDISHSPDRSDLPKLDSPSSISNSDSPRDINLDQQDSSTKKKRKRKLKKDDDKGEMNVEPQLSKIVPPLRLKKIQSLQEAVSTCPSNWINSENSQEPQEVVPSFRFYQPIPPPDPELTKDASNYRIVSGTTPPFDECVDSTGSTVQTLDKWGVDISQDEKDEGFRQNKLKLKLRDLKKKTMELGTEMLRTAMTSPDNSVKETIVSYEDQINRLTSLLKKLPEAAAGQLENTSSGSIVTSTISGALQTSISSSMCASSSPEPPKLSPKIPMESGSSLNPLQVRDSPPVLAKATLGHGEDTEDSWREFEGLRGLLKITKKGKQGKNHDDNSVASSVITTTSDNSINEEINFDNKSVIDLALNKITKPEINSVKLSNQVRAIKIKSLGGLLEVPEVIKIDLRKTPSPGAMVIDTDGVLQEFDKRSKPENDAIVQSVNSEDSLDIQVSQDNTHRICTPAPTISSSAEAFKRPVTLEDCLDTNNPKDLMLADEFPTLGSWLAKMSTKVPNEVPKNLTKKRTNEQIVIESRTPAYQPNIQIYNQTNGKNVGIDLTTNRNSLRENGRDWGDERWENQEQRHQQSSQEYINGSVGMNNIQMAMQQQNQQMTTEYCSPSVPLGRYYPRNYPIDPYSLPYGYNHPSLAAASLWSGALLQYPFLRPRGLPQGYQPRFPGNVMQYNMPPGAMSQQRLPPPPYTLPGQSQGPQTSQDPKKVQPTIELSRNGGGNFDPNVLNKRKEYPPVSLSQSVPNYSNQRVQQPQLSREQYTKAYADSNVRVTVSEAHREQMNYQQPWRGPILAPGALGMRNYPINTNWTSDPCSLLAALSPAALQNFSTPMPMVTRVRNTKETVDQARNCETPHLGKVNYSPNTVRTLQCSNCALPGPLFKCLGCEVAFYCDETCQTRHWSRHVVSCPKKMPKLKKVVP